jgi:hypothetical protein
MPENDPQAHRKRKNLTLLAALLALVAILFYVTKLKLSQTV